MDLQVDLMKKLFTEALRASAKAREVLSKKMPDRQNEFIAAAYMNKAISSMSAARVYYHSNLDELNNSVVDDLFREFDNLTDEFLSCLAEHHSHQWTEEAYNTILDLMKIIGISL